MYVLAEEFGEAEFVYVGGAVFEAVDSIFVYVYSCDLQACVCEDECEGESDVSEAEYDDVAV